MTCSSISGGRTLRDDPDSGAGPRIGPPWNLGVTTRPHDWSWNKAGICLYCVHCCQLNERMPMRRFGYPTRVVEPPVWPEARDGGKCTWYVYKDPALVPEEVYRRTRHDTARPLLQVADPLGRLRALHAERDPLYRETAHFVIETGRPSVPTLVNMILMQLELGGPGPTPA